MMIPVAEGLFKQIQAKEGTKACEEFQTCRLHFEAAEMQQPSGT